VATREHKNTVLMATDIPFWKASTGAEQRMTSLARYLSQAPFRLVTFYVGQLSPDDPKRIADSGLDVIFFESERPPEAFLARMSWYVDATRRQLQRLVGRGQLAATTTTADSSPQPLQIADYRWPWAIEQFREAVQRVRPDTIICQYVTMTYLLEALSLVERRRIRCLVDTHDILHDRGMQFGSAGYLHWLEISQAEETRLWNKFDAVIAIQDEEAAMIHEMAPDPKMIVTPHGIDYLLESANLNCTRKGDSNELVVGYIGSANYSNWHAINRFLIEAWPDLMELEFPQVKLLIAGKICSWFRMQGKGLEGNELMQRVELAGEVPGLEDFYRRIDIAVNPVLFGTGLKIKNVEAMAFGKPLVTTPQGVAGMSPQAKRACIVAENLIDFPGEIRRLIADPEECFRMGQDAGKVAKSDFSDKAAFAPLRAFLLDSA